MKEINASATQKETEFLENTEEQIYFNTINLQNANNDRAIFPIRMGQVKKSGYLNILHSDHDTGRSPQWQNDAFSCVTDLGKNNGN